MTEGMQRLWVEKWMIALCLLFGTMAPSKALYIWVIISTFLLLVTRIGHGKCIVFSFIINFLLVCWFPEFYR